MSQAEALRAIDATLAGEAVDPRFAELAELALLLRDERPEPPPSLVALDARVARRFAGGPAAPPRRRRRAWLWAPASGLATALAVAVVIVLAGTSPQRPPLSPHAASSAAGAAAGAAPGAPTGAARRQPAPTRPALAAATAGRLAPHAAASVPAFAPAGTPGVAAVPQPAPSGRKIIQGAQLALTTAPARIDQVSQEVFDVAGRFGAVVLSSQVTQGGPGGYAQFQLSVPSSALGQAMGALSSLPYARVASRTDTTQDVSDPYQAAVRALNDARALRTSLLKQLAAATTTAQIDSLTARIHDAEASIASDEATLRRLQRQVDFSQVTVTVNAGTIVPVTPSSRGSGGFTLGRAAHDAGRVLTVAAGVALIGAAALVPVGLLAALVWWVAAAVRRRRREQALDLA